MAKVWIQSADYSSKELGELSKEKIIAAFDSVSWYLELSKFKEDDANPDCPPGFGIIKDGNILHLCPFDANSMFFNLHYVDNARFLGLFSMKRKKHHYVEDHPIKNAHRLISHFMADDLTQILDIE